MNIAPTAAATSLDPVVLSPVSDAVTRVNQPVSFQVSAGDFSGDTPTFAVTSAGTFGQPSTYTAPANVTVKIAPGIERHGNCHAHTEYWLHRDT